MVYYDALIVRDAHKIMKYKIIVIVFLVLQSYSTQAGVGKILVEILEPLFKQSVKQVDEISKNTLTTNDILAIQGIKIVARPLSNLQGESHIDDKNTKPMRSLDEIFGEDDELILKELSKEDDELILKELSNYDKNSDEYKIINIIANDLELCNTQDINKYLSFIDLYVHNKSPIKDTLLSSESKDFYKRYKANCNVNDINILGISIDEVNKLAYVEVTGNNAFISGVINLSYKSIITFKFENSIWKLWDGVIVEKNIKILDQNWWSYGRKSSKCELLDKYNILQPLNVLVSESYKEFNCSTNGVIKENFLIVSCKSKEIDTNLIYSKTKSQCEKIGSLLRKNNEINNP